MSESRRDFLKVAGASLLGLGLGAPAAITVARGSTQEATGADGSSRLALVVDTAKCQKKGDGCRACIDACHSTHNVPDMGSAQHEIKWVWKEPYRNTFPTQVHPYTKDTLRDREVLVLCNHCERPPCVRVCPTQATFKTDGGIVAMDQHRCIGCRYCVAACPYGARSFNWKDPRPFIDDVHTEFPTRTKGVVEKCNLCAERLALGQLPACVEACQAEAGALTFGDVHDPESEVSHILRTTNTIRRRPGLGTAPHVFYVV